jgi:formylglycine-generating enzyme required for sulfatase activity
MMNARSFQRWLLLPMASLLTALVMVPAASAVVTIDWLTVGNPGNGCETQVEGCFGAVDDVYLIGKFEITNDQYAECLNAVAVTDPNGLYNTGMGGSSGGITRSGSPGTYSYVAKVGKEDMPVSRVSFYDSLRFANWLHNGQPVGTQDDSTTEDGAYTITPAGIADNSIVRNPEAIVFITSEDEWYKAAYYDSGSTSYFDFPASSDAKTGCADPGATANTANCRDSNRGVTDVGSYTGSASPYGTFDQGGNLYEWNESVLSGTARGLRGGGYINAVDFLAASTQSISGPSSESRDIGIRIASLGPPAPVPSMGPVGMAVLSSLLGLVSWRRLRS